MDKRKGDLVGDYEILRELPSGGFGRAFLATHTGTWQSVVLKFPHAADYDEAAKEARALAGRKHDAIMTVHDVVSDDEPYVVLEYVNGVGLDDYLSHVEEPLRPSEWWRTLRPLLSGVQHLHSSGIVHRDIKPANIILRDSSPTKPVIIDFGAARSTNEYLSAAIGTSMYMDPTITIGDLQADPSWDIYSLAVLSFEAMFPNEFEVLRSAADDRKEITYYQVRSNMRKHLAGFDGALLEALAVALDENLRPRQIIDWLTLMVRPDAEESGMSDLPPHSSHEPTGATHTLASKSHEIERRFDLPDGSVRFADPNGNLLDPQRSLVTFWSTWEYDSHEVTNDSVDDDMNVKEAREHIEFVLRTPQYAIRIVKNDGEGYHGNTLVSTVRSDADVT